MPSIKEIIPVIVDRVDQQFQADTPGYIDVVPTGINAIDEVIGGFRRGDVSLLSGESGVGKSTLAIQIASLISGFLNMQPVIYISWRDATFHSAMKVIGYVAAIEEREFQKGNLTDDDWYRFTEAINRFEDSNLIIENLSPEFDVLASFLSGLVNDNRSSSALVVIEDCWGYSDHYDSAIAFLKWIKQLALKNNLAVLLTGSTNQFSHTDRWGCLRDSSDLNLDLACTNDSEAVTRNLFIRKQRLGQPSLVTLRYNPVDLYH